MSEPRWLNGDEDRAWRGIRRVDVVVLAAIRRDLQSEAGLSEADYEVLTHLSESNEDSLRVGELATRLRWSTSRLAHQLTRMETRGLVTRTSRHDDGRGSDVALTDDGRATVEGTAPGHVESVRRHLFDHLSADQVASLADITGTLLAAHKPATRTT